MKFRTVTFYRTAEGKRPVAEWLDGLDDVQAKAVAIGVKFFEEYPNPVVPEKFFEKVSNHIWEIKCHYGKEQFRLLAFRGNGSIIVAVHGFAKKSMSLKNRHLELAEDRRRDYFRRTRETRQS